MTKIIIDLIKKIYRFFTLLLISKFVFLTFCHLIDILTKYQLRYRAYSSVG